MQMDKSEILTSYKLAKKKGKQLQILAELNGCNKLAIVRILIEGGFDPRGFNEVLSKKEREAMEAEEKKNIEEKAVQAEPDPEEKHSVIREALEVEKIRTIEELRERNKNLVGLNDELIEENRKLRDKNYELKKENEEIKAYWQNRCSQCTEESVSELATVQLRAEKLHIKLQEAEERIHKLEQGIIKMVIE